MNNGRQVVIIGGARIPFARSGTSYANCTNQDLLTAALQSLVKKFNLAGQKVDDVAGGAVLKHSRDFNLTRESVLSSGLHATTPAVDMQRACGTSLDTAIYIANKIALGQIDVGIAAGTDTNSDVPLEFSEKFSQLLVRSTRAKGPVDILKIWRAFRPGQLKPVLPTVAEPRTHKSMGEHCEAMAQHWNISRENQDALALASHKNGAKAYQEGFYDDLVYEYQGLKRDNNLRESTSLEKLGKLKPVFERSEKGTLTAGNSTPLTDGASAVLLASHEWAQKNNYPILAKITFAQVAAVDFVAGEGLLMAPTVAVSKMLKQANLSLQDFDLYEIHEAFAAQVLCTLRAWESTEYCQKYLERSEPMGAIETSKMNVKGGSVALGHPFAATGARIIGTGAKILDQTQQKRMLISICTAGGMGVSAILEKN